MNWIHTIKIKNFKGFPKEEKFELGGYIYSTPMQ